MKALLSLEYQKEWVRQNNKKLAEQKRMRKVIVALTVDKNIHSSIVPGKETTSTREIDRAFDEEKEYQCN